MDFTEGKINGSIPCEGCGTNVVRGIVHKLSDDINVFICDDCYENSTEMVVEPKEGLGQYQEY